MYEDNKSLKFLRRLYTTLYLICVVFNIVLSRKVGFVNFFAIIVWTYGVLSYLGIIKHVEHTDGNKVIYSTSVPILPIVATRVAQFLLGKFLHVGMKEVEVIPFFICCFIDIVLLILAIIDSGSYYYEGVVEQDSDDQSIVTVEGTKEEEI